MALIKCKECGNAISSKAETCPKCGLRLKPGPEAKSGSGCIVSLFKLVGGLAGAGIGLIVAVSFLSNQNSVTPMRQLEIRCEEASKTQPDGAERRSFYESCIAGGSLAIRAQERINREKNQTGDKPTSVGGSDSISSPASPGPAQDTVPPVLPTAESAAPPPALQVPPSAQSSTPTQSPEVLPLVAPSQSPQEKADPSNDSSK